jgi:hypothetical protein
MTIFNTPFFELGLQNLMLTTLHQTKAQAEAAAEAEAEAQPGAGGGSEDAQLLSPTQDNPEAGQATGLDAQDRERQVSKTMLLPLKKVLC